MLNLPNLFNLRVQRSLSWSSFFSNSYNYDQQSFFISFNFVIVWHLVLTFASSVYILNISTLLPSSSSIPLGVETYLFFSSSWIPKSTIPLAMSSGSILALALLRISSTPLNLRAISYSKSFSYSIESCFSLILLYFSSDSSL